MTNKKELSIEELNKATGGTFQHESGYVFDSIEDIKKYVRGLSVQGYKVFESGYIKDIGKVKFLKMINDTTAQFEHYGEYFTVGDNDIYFVRRYGIK